MKRIGLAVLVAGVLAAGVAQAHEPRIEMKREMLEHPEFWALAHLNKPRLGVQLVGITPELREFYGSDADTGVLVGKVMEDSAAQKAGIQVGDLIIAVDGEKVGSHGDLIRYLAGKSEQDVEVSVIRKKRQRDLRVTLPEAPKVEMPDMKGFKVLEYQLDDGMKHLEDRLDDLERRLNELEQR